MIPLDEEELIDDDCDTDGAAFLEEMKFFSQIIQEEAQVQNTPITSAFLLKYIMNKGLQHVYSNFYVVLRITVTIPITKASCRRSFSALKLVKFYL